MLGPWINSQKSVWAEKDLTHDFQSYFTSKVWTYPSGSRLGWKDMWDEHFSLIDERVSDKAKKLYRIETRSNTNVVSGCWTEHLEQNYGQATSQKIIAGACPSHKLTNQANTINIYHVH
jgi:hypothetical protein